MLLGSIGSLKRQGYTSLGTIHSQPIVHNKLKGERLRSPGRCPRCGYPLRYDRGGYMCEFCGFPGTRSSLLNSIRNFERNVRSKMNSLMEKSRARPYERMIVQYPYAMRQQICVSCKLRIPPGIQSCPYCGTPQVLPQPRQEPSSTTMTIDPVDQEVLDYIAARNGTISISQAAKDLSIDPGALRLRLERLKSSGLLRAA
jgi:ribosomal protein L40E/ribosomal protein L37E